MRAVVDENVLIVANDLTRRSLGLDPICPEADDQCGLNCAEFLMDLIERGGVSLDEEQEVLTKYKAHCSFRGQPGVGDAFLKAVFERGYLSGWAERISIRSVTGDIRLPSSFVACGFDNDDHLWIAISLNSPNRPPVYNAVDSDYAEHLGALTALGVAVRQLCTTT